MSPGRVWDVPVSECSATLPWSSCGDIPGFVTQQWSSACGDGRETLCSSLILYPELDLAGSCSATSPFPGGQKIKRTSSHQRSQRTGERISSDFSLLPPKHSLTCVLSLGLSPRAAPQGSLFLKQENAGFWMDLSCLAELEVSVSPLTGEFHHCIVLS